ncbi:protein MEI2-like 1 isoform X2 [Ziziphus jujuba]|uniref:Protein MEI2-like 1 isoform X2 n=1 Tax=Ziziphus jujuba TaxID=326968 RepID=A0A6P4A178_ZIZJJ|nr:protein MEI2-like 1 isoform X2 [Ziziphus jujuba]
MQRGVSASPHFFEDICYSSEREVRKPKTMPNYQAHSVDCSEMPLSNLSREQAERQSIGQGVAPFSKASWKPMDHHLKLWPDLYKKPVSYSMDGKTSLINESHHESGLFSSSMTEMFSRKLRLSANDVLSHQPANIVVSHDEEEPFESLKEIEAQTIGNLLPDEDDLFSGVTDKFGYKGHANNMHEFEDFDLFSSSGGMELEGDDHPSVGLREYHLVGGVSSGQSGCIGSFAGEHPSRTLFVRNINSNVEDSELKALFEKYGDIQALYTSCKHRGFVMISYYDIRAAQNAMRALQSKPLRRRMLDIHYSIPKDNPSEKDVNQGTLAVFNLDSSVSNDELRQIFGVYGQIKDIHETPHKQHGKFVEFYDIRAAEAALRALNKTDIGGKQVKLEPSCPGGARQGSMQVPEQEQNGTDLGHSPCNNLSLGCKGVIVSSWMINGLNQGVYSVIQSPMNTFTENSLSHQTSSVTNVLPSPVRMASAGKQVGFYDSNNNSLDEMNFGNQRIPTFHPHSFPEYHDSLAHGIPCNSSTTLADLTSMGLRMTEGMDSRHFHGASTTRHAVEHKVGVVGSSGNGSGPVHEHRNVWNNPNQYQQHPSSPMMWQNSPSFVNGLHAHRIPLMSGFPRAPPHMLNSASSLPHHIGSAPSVTPSLWERHAYSGESPETSSLHLGSLGSPGFSGSPHLHPMEISSHNMLSQVGGNCMDMTTNVGQHSSQHICHIFPGRNPVISMPTSFDSPNDHARNLSHRRNEVNSNSADKKQYELDIDRILHGEDSRTTLMIKNIPNKYTSKMLLAAIDEHCRGTYDFLYLPIDFKNKCNVGYAFINMIDPQQIVPFHLAFNGKKWEKFNSEKVASLAYARIQGKSALIAHFQNSSLMNEDKRCRPILFHTDGPNAGDPEPFPMGTNIRSRPGKPRTNGNEGNYNQGISSVSASGEEYLNGLDLVPGSSKDSD